MGGTQCVEGGTGKAGPRSCRTQELARSSARENEWQKKAGSLHSTRMGMRSKPEATCEAKKPLRMYAQTQLLEEQGEWRICYERPAAIRACVSPARTYSGECCKANEYNED